MKNRKTWLTALAVATGTALVLLFGCAKDDNPAGPGDETPTGTDYFVSTPASNHYIPDLYFHYDYVDTIRTNTAVDTFILLASTGQTTLAYTPNELFCVVRWTYDSAPPNYDTYYDTIAPNGKIHISLVAVKGTLSDTLTWDVKINTLPWIETSQYQIQTTVYTGNTYTDTVIVSDVDGDKPAFTVTDTGGLGVHVTSVTQTGDTTYGIINWTVTKTGTFGVSINVVDSVGGTVGYDTSLALIFKAQNKKLITSTPQLMPYGTAVGAEYRVIVGIFDEYRAGLTGQLLRGPSGMTLTDSVVSWTPSAAAEETVKVVMSNTSYSRGSDTLTWIVKAVASSNFVFWYNATTNAYNLQQANPGPGLPAGATVFQGIIATWNARLMTSDNNTDFALGNGPAQSGRSAIFYSADLCDKQGTAVKAMVRGEFRDGWSGNAFCNEGRITLKIGVIDLTVYRDLPVPNGYGGTITCDALYLGGCPACQNGWDYNMKFYYHPGTKVTIPGLMAEEIVTLQAPPGRPADQEPSILDGKFFDIDVTTQVQWILDQKGKDYVTPAKAGDYGIVFLVPNDETAGGTGKINLYATECITATTPYTPSNDAPWTQDGNTMHLYLEGDITAAP